MFISSSKALKALLAVASVLAFSSSSNAEETPSRKLKKGKKPKSKTIAFDSVRTMRQDTIAVGNEHRTISLTDPTAGTPSMIGATAVMHYFLFEPNTITEANVASKMSDKSSSVGYSSVVCTITLANQGTFNPERGTCTLSFEFQYEGVDSSLVGIYSGDILQQTKAGHEGVIVGGTGKLHKIKGGHVKYDRTVFDAVGDDVFVLEKMELHPKK
ncbi:unnamed protein product [Pseudo-nitzschia multistriata]|uniref:Dirigent protein n=1 Tax=Pseudo-nitzschia multistriata TaxID=183589 RepID=A0A448Z3X7_9STRA|nr:unnamed protein product [Pseudo-nitzschia multistriata]